MNIRVMNAVDKKKEIKLGFELDEAYHKLSLERIENHKQQLSLI